jgi:Dolichyl-phosphate-mannose-protein mannosyltransferase
VTSEIQTRAPSAGQSWWRRDEALLAYIAAATVVLHALTAGRYGFHRDELALLDDARRLAWGYVAYPPVAPFFARLSLVLVGTSLAGFRVFAALAQAVALVVTGLMTRELGGRREAQLLAVAAAVPACLAEGALMQYVSFDYLFWVLTAYFMLRLLKSRDPRWWVAIGCAIGLGMMSKYGMAFLVAGVAVGVLLTDARRLLKSRWLLLGVALSLIVCLPNLLWQVRHDFVSLDFLRHIHARDVRWGRTKDFLPEQLQFTLLGAPLWIAGLWFHLVSPRGRSFRALGWMYVTPLLLFVIAKGRGYYLLPAYPMLYAAGSVRFAGAIASRRPAVRNLWRGVAWAALAADVVLVAAIALPMTPVNSAWWKFASGINGDLREEIGWPELVETVARVRDSLPSAERARLGILAVNYGEAGAINLYGPAYGLPQAISGMNSFWQRGYGNPPPERLIVVGMSQAGAERRFEGCRLAAHSWNRYGVRNEETVDHPDIFVCGGPRQGWPEFWKSFRYYG